VVRIRFNIAWSQKGPHCPEFPGGSEQKKKKTRRRKEREEEKKEKKEGKGKVSTGMGLSRGGRTSEASPNNHSKKRGGPSPRPFAFRSGLCRDGGKDSMIPFSLEAGEGKPCRPASHARGGRRKKRKGEKEGNPRLCLPGETRKKMQRLPPSPERGKERRENLPARDHDQSPSMKATHRKDARRRHSSTEKKRKKGKGGGSV